MKLIWTESDYGYPLKNQCLEPWNQGLNPISFFISLKEVQPQTVRHTQYVGSALHGAKRTETRREIWSHNFCQLLPCFIILVLQRRAESLFQIQFKNAKNKLWEGARSLAETRRTFTRKRELMLKRMEAGQNKEYVPLKNIWTGWYTWASCP